MDNFYLAWRDAATKPENNEDWLNDRQVPYSLKRLKNITKDHVVTHLVCQSSPPAEVVKLTPQLTHLAVDYFTASNDHSSSWSELTELRCLVLSMSGGELEQDQLLKTPLTSLRELHLRNFPLQSSAQLTYIQQLSNLERLDISYKSSSRHFRTTNSGNDFIKGLEESPDLFSKLSSLSSLSLTNFGLKSITPSITLLTKLEVLNLSGNDFSADGLPEVVTQLTSLKELNLSMCKLTTLPASMANLINLKKLDLEMNDFSSTGLPDVLGKLASLHDLNLSSCVTDLSPQSHTQPLSLPSPDVPLAGRLDVIAAMTSLRKLKLCRCSLTELPANLSQLVQLEELDLSSTNLSSDGLPEGICTLPAVKKLCMNQCSLTQLPTRISRLSNLEVLLLNYNKFSSNGLPDEIGQLVSLKELNLSNCDLSSVPESLSNLTNLEVLDISYQSYDEVQLRLPDMLFERLTSLKELSVTGDRLTDLPSSLFRLHNLEVLKLRFNEFSGGLPDVWGELSSLRQLDLAFCQLKELPRSIGQLKRLEELDLTKNTFEDGALPDVVCDLTSLKSLNLSQCQLTSFPSRLKCLQQLESLQLEMNQFTNKGILPVYGLTSLKSLSLTNMPRLESLGYRILNLTNLEDLSAGGDSSRSALTSPPKAVIQNGVEAIRQFYQETTDTSATHQPITTVMVIGHSGAGKTSLIKTLQSEDKQRVLTGRSSDGKEIDESTKVFNFEDVSLESSDNEHALVEKTTLRFIDIGGQEIYHPTYQMTFREKCVVVVVVNMEEYKERTYESTDSVNRVQSTDREAVQRLYFDWLANFYLPNPTLASPMLVLTHKDKFSEEEFQRLQEEFLRTSDAIRDEVIDEHSILDHGSDFSNVDQPLFCVDDVFTIGKEDNYQVFDDIKASLYRASHQHAKEVSNRWKEVSDAVKQLPGCFLRKSAIHGHLRDTFGVRVEQLEVMLSEMHSCGQLLWYKDVNPLKSYVFHNIPAVTELLKILYDHADSDKWRNLRPCRGLDEESYHQLVENFCSAGILDQVLLTDLIQAESPFKSKTEIGLALTLLESFNLVYGPTKFGSQDCYLVSHFFKGYLGEAVPSGSEVQLRVDLVFYGYVVPASAFHHITLMLLRGFSHPRNFDTCEVRQNGAVLKCVASNMVASLTHNRKSQKVTIVLTDLARNINNLWNCFTRFTNQIIDETRHTWKAAGMKCIFYCPHCLLTDNPHPRKETNPSWCKLSSQLTPSYNGEKLAACGEDMDIPAALMFPCQPLTPSVINDYVSSRLRVRRGEPAYGTSVQPEGAEGEQMASVEESLGDGSGDGSDDESSDLSDGDDYFHPAGDSSRISMRALRVVPTTRRSIKALFNNTDKVYRMSAPMRGRALVINNNWFGPSDTRDGSNVDVYNLVTLLTALKFEHSVETDLTADGMLSAIKHETKSNHHQDYGMFILVIMSHGGRNNYICGTDGTNVSLSEVCDLLSAGRFPQMRGKPKLIVIQACSGVRRDHGEAGTDIPSTSVLTTDTPPGAPRSSHDFLNGDDFIVIKSSFESYVSMRNRNYGSLFIRVLVATFYKHASHRDVEKLCKIMQSRVRAKSQELAGRDPQHATGQIPVYFSTLTHLRKLFLFPGYDGPNS